MVRQRNQGKEEWITWQTRTGRHGTNRNGAELTKLLNGRFYHLNLETRAAEVAQATTNNLNHAAALAAAAAAPAVLGTGAFGGAGGAAAGGGVPGVGVPGAAGVHVLGGPRPLRPIDGDDENDNEDENGSEDQHEDIKRPEGEDEDGQGDIEQDERQRGDGQDDADGEQLSETDGQPTQDESNGEDEEEPQRPEHAAWNAINNVQQSRNSNGRAGSSRNKRPMVGGKAPPGKRPAGKGLKNVPKEWQISSSIIRADRVTSADKQQALEANLPGFTAREGWEGGWQLDALLGEGSFGRVNLYQRWLNGRIQDRVAVKDCFVDFYDWTNVTRWWGNNVADPGDRVHVEIKSMELIKSRPDSTRCVRMRHFEVDNSRKFYRIYMSFHPFGTLDGLLNEPQYRRDDHIPEPALWSFFNDLVSACLVMQYGGVKEEEAAEEWQFIVHRDLKPANVFLDDPSKKEEFPSYPTCVVGDFGLAVITDDNDALNPDGYNGGVGTPSWQAPEQHHFVRHITLVAARPADRLGEWTNVWSIGAIMIRLMNREPSPTSPLFDDAREAQPELTSNGSGYSEPLRNLVKRCVKYVPRQRISLRELQDNIQRLTGDDPTNDLAEGLRTFKSTNEVEHELHFPQDRYKHQPAGSGI